MRQASKLMAVAREQGGFTLGEVLIACALILVGIAALGSALRTGIEGVEFGRQQTTAVFLAEQGAERVRSAAIKQTDLGTVITGNFPAEAYGNISGATAYRRFYTITNVASGAPAGSKRVDVAVAYKPVTAGGVSSTERQVTVRMLLVPR